MGIHFCKEAGHRMRRWAVQCGCACPKAGSEAEAEEDEEAARLRRARRREKCRDEMIPECFRCYKNKALDDADVHEENYCFKCYRRRRERALYGPPPPKKPLRERCAYFWAGWADPVVTFEVHPDDLPPPAGRADEKGKGPPAASPGDMDGAAIEVVGSGSTSASTSASASVA